MLESTCLTLDPDCLQYRKAIAMQFEPFDMNQKARIVNVVVIVMHYKLSDQD